MGFVLEFYFSSFDDVASTHDIDIDNPRSVTNEQPASSNKKTPLVIKNVYNQINTHGDHI